MSHPQSQSSVVLKLPLSAGDRDQLSRFEVRHVNVALIVTRDVTPVDDVIPMRHVVAAFRRDAAEIFLRRHQRISLEQRL